MNDQDDRKPTGQNSKMPPFHQLEMSKTKRINEDISGFFDAFKSYAQSNEKYRQDFLLKYLEMIQNKKTELSNDKMLLDFLFSEKEILNDRIAKARISRESGDQKLLEECINILIDPLMVLINERLAANKELDLPIAETREVTVTERELDDQSGVSENVAYELPENFLQIDCNADQKAILEYFMRLASRKNELNNKPYMSEEDVTELLHNNFKVFKCKPKHRYYEINLTKRQKGRLRYLVYEFYEKYATNSRDKVMFGYFLINNFELFKDDPIHSILKNMGQSKAPVQAHRI